MNAPLNNQVLFLQFARFSGDGKYYPCLFSYTYFIWNNPLQCCVIFSEHLFEDHIGNKCTMMDTLSLIILLACLSALLLAYMMQFYSIDSLTHSLSGGDISRYSMNGVTQKII